MRRGWTDDRICLERGRRRRLTYKQTRTRRGFGGGDPDGGQGITTRILGSYSIMSEWKVDARLGLLVPAADSALNEARRAPDQVYKRTIYGGLSPERSSARAGPGVQIGQNIWRTQRRDLL